MRHKLRDTDLRSRNIQIISMTRRGKPIPNPSAATMIREGDKLLCYGDLRELRALMGDKAAKPTRKKRKT